jgi:hypothetical protein
LQDFFTLICTIFGGVTHTIYHSTMHINRDEPLYPSIKSGKTRQDIANILEVDRKVIFRQLRSIGINHGMKLSAKEIEMYRRKFVDVDHTE